MSQSIPAEPHALLGKSRLIEKTSYENRSPDKWNLDAARINALRTANDHLDAALKANDAVETKNHFTVVAKNEAVGNVRAVLRGFIHYLVGHEGKVTDEVLQQLGIPPRHKTKHEPLPPPSEAPVVNIVTGHNHDADLYFFDNQAGHPTQYLANASYYAVMLNHRLQGTADWHQQTITRKHLTLHFGDEAAGQTLEVRAAWLNPRLEAGPWSKITSAIVT